MELSRVIIGSLVTEKTERLKGERVYTLAVASDATKVEVENALKRFFDVEVMSVRVMRVRPKARWATAQRIFTKRSRFKKALVTLSDKSKGLDLAQFRTV